MDGEISFQSDRRVRLLSPFTQHPAHQPPSSRAHQVGKKVCREPEDESDDGAESGGGGGGVPLEYLEGLHERHEELLEELRGAPVGRRIHTSKSPKRLRPMV